MISEHPEDIVLLDYVEGVLEGDESQTVRRHIAGCRACRRTLAEISSAVDELERLPTAEIPHDAFGVAGGRRRAKVMARLAPLLLAAAAVVIALIFWKAPPDNRTVTTRRSTPVPVSTRMQVPLPVPRLDTLRSNLDDLDAVVGRLKGEDGFYVVVSEADYSTAYDRLNVWSKSDEPGSTVVLMTVPDAARSRSQPEAESAQVK